MKNIKIKIAYDGTHFHGWQVQPGRATIQGALIEVAERLVGSRTIVHGAGRTDAGVHAFGQVANFRADTRLDPAEFQRAFNALLPPTIRVVETEEVELRFHSRWDAQAKTYQYRIFRGRVLSPFDRSFALHYPFPLDEEAMAAAAKIFEGEHDFSSFAASPGADAKGRDVNPRREIFRSEIARRPPPRFGPPADGPEKETNDELVYLVRGRSFLRYMVRKLVGTLLEVGRGRLTLDDVRELYELRDRSRSGPTAPPQGLALVSVEYNEPWRINVP